MNVNLSHLTTVVRRVCLTYFIGLLNCAVRNSKHFQRLVKFKRQCTKKLFKFYLVAKSLTKLYVKSKRSRLKVWYINRTFTYPKGSNVRKMFDSIQSIEKVNFNRKSSLHRIQNYQCTPSVNLQKERKVLSVKYKCLW